MFGFDSLRSHRSNGRKSTAVLAVALAATTALGLAACSASTTTSTAKSATDAKAAAMLPHAVESSGVLTVGTYAPEPPMRYLGSDGKMTGFDADLISAVAKNLGLSTKFVNMDWDGLLPALKAKRFDVIAAAMGDLAPRRANGNFVDYLYAGASAVVLDKNKGEYTSQSDLCGKNVGFETGVAAATELPIISTKCTSDGKAAITLLPFANDGAGLTALDSGRADAYVMDSTAGSYQAQLSRGKANPLAVVLNGIITPSNLGFVVGKQNTGLEKAVQSSLNDLIKSGAYKKLLSKYGFDAYAVTSATINVTYRTS